MPCLNDFLHERDLSLLQRLCLGSLFHSVNVDCLVFYLPSFVVLEECCRAELYVVSLLDVYDALAQSHSCLSLQLSAARQCENLVVGELLAGTSELRSIDVLYLTVDLGKPPQNSVHIHCSLADRLSYALHGPESLFVVADAAVPERDYPFDDVLPY